MNEEAYKRFVRQDIEAKMMLTARFFDSEDGDFEKFLVDYFQLSLKWTADTATQVARDIVQTYERVLVADLENHSAV